MTKIIGGSHHGREIDYDLTYLYVPTINPTSFIAREDKVSVEVYKLLQIRGDKEIFSVYIPEVWTADTAIRLLLAAA